MPSSFSGPELASVVLIWCEMLDLYVGIREGKSGYFANGCPLA